MNTFWAILRNFRFQDFLDIVFLSVIVYHLAVWFKGTKAFRALIGLALLGVIYTAAKSSGLFLTSWVFQIFWQVLIILLIVVFQTEIRQVLERVNPMQALGLRRVNGSKGWGHKCAQGAFDLAQSYVGALIIVERQERVDTWITGGQTLEADPSPEMLCMIFQHSSPLHDGAVVIRNGRIVRAGCFLPLSFADNLPHDWGTRHRAGLGLSERCDAWVIVVSEERGQVSLAREGEMHGLEQEADLEASLEQAIAKREGHNKRWVQRLKQAVFQRWYLKLATVAGVGLIWLLLAGQQDFERALSVPVQIQNLPQHLKIVDPVNPQVVVTVRGVRKEASTLTEKNVSVRANLTRARPGTTTIFLSQESVQLPDSGVRVVRVTPDEITLTIESVKKKKKNE